MLINLICQVELFMSIDIAECFYPLIFLGREGKYTNTLKVSIGVGSCCKTAPSGYFESSEALYLGGIVAGWDHCDVLPNRSTRSSGSVTICLLVVGPG